MAIAQIQLDWHRDSKGYRLVDTGKYGLLICNLGGELIDTQPLKRRDMAFKAFANVKSANELLAFVGFYGLLEYPAYDRVVPGRGSSFCGVVGSTPEGGLIVPDEDHEIALPGECVEEHLKTAMLFRELLTRSGDSWRGISLSARAGLAKALDDTEFGTVGLVRDSRIGLHLTWTASTLMNGLWLQLATHLGKNVRHRTCEWCGTFFEVGVKGGRRSDARFCCASHQVQFNSRNRGHRKSNPSISKAKKKGEAVRHGGVIKRDS